MGDAEARARIRSSGDGVLLLLLSPVFHGLYLHLTVGKVRTAITVDIISCYVLYKFRNAVVMTTRMHFLHSPFVHPFCLWRGGSHVSSHVMPAQPPTPPHRSPRGTTIIVIAYIIKIRGIDHFGLVHGERAKEGQDARILIQLPSPARDAQSLLLSLGRGCLRA